MEPTTPKKTAPLMSEKRIKQLKSDYVTMMRQQMDRPLSLAEREADGYERGLVKARKEYEADRTKTRAVVQALVNRINRCGHDTDCPMFWDELRNFPAHYEGKEGPTTVAREPETQKPCNCGHDEALARAEAELNITPQSE